MHTQTPMALTNALSTSVVCVVALDIFSDSDAMFSETVILPRLARDLTELLDGNIVRRSDTSALEPGPGLRETSFATVSRRMMSDWSCR